MQFCSRAQIDRRHRQVTSCSATRLTSTGSSIAPWTNWSACNDSVKAKTYHRLSTLTSVGRDRFLRNKAKKSLEFSVCEMEAWTLLCPSPGGAKAGAGAAEPKSRALETDASRLNGRLHAAWGSSAVLASQGGDSDGRCRMHGGAISGPRRQRACELSTCKAETRALCQAGRNPGPGRIWLQTLPIAKLAHKLGEYMPKQHQEAAQGGVVGGIVGSILEGMK